MGDRQPERRTRPSVVFGGFGERDSFVVAELAVTGYCIQMSRVIVIGDGIVGLSTALALLNRGADVLVMGTPGSGAAASWGNAGHIAIEQVEPLASLSNLISLPRRLFTFGGPAGFPARSARHWVPFGLRMLGFSSTRRFETGRTALTGLAAMALPSWRELVKDLGEPALLVENGHHVVWESYSGYLHGKRAWERRDTGETTFRPFASEELEKIASLISKPLAGGVHFEGTASISSHADLRNSLLHAIKSRGGKVRSERARRLADLDADRVVVCAGVGSAGLIRKHSWLRVPLIAERGYHIEGVPRNWPREMPPVVFEDRSIIATRFADRLRVAGFVEFSGSECPPDERKFSALHRHCDDLGISLEGARRWMGARPTLPDYLPALGRIPDDSRIFYAFGHQHLGLTLGPATARIMADLVLDDDPGVDLSPFDLARFR